MMMGFASMSQEFPPLERRSPGLSTLIPATKSTADDLNAAMVPAADQLRHKQEHNRSRRETGSSEACIDSFLPSPPVLDPAAGTSSLPPLISCATPERPPRAGTPSPRLRVCSCEDGEQHAAGAMPAPRAGTPDVVLTPRKPSHQRSPSLCDVLRSSIDRLPRMRISTDSVRTHEPEPDCEDEELWMHDVYEPRVQCSKTPRTSLLHSLDQAIARTAAEDGLAHSDCSWISVVDGLQQALTDHLNDPAMVEAICGMVSSLLEKHAKAAGLVDPAHVLPQLKSALDTHGSSSSTVVAICTAADVICSKTTAGRANARAICLLDSMQVLLAEFHASPEVQAEVCSSIWAICSGSPENKHYAGQIGLLNTISAALDQNASSCQTLRDFGHDAVGAICQGHKNNTWLALRLGLWHTGGK